ncbi:GNAT family N-acetyltransferase [Phaeacidiphilus oryzae]|jgi:GNAT superfamily N-acetyltransferase|uniref:GNAT family N-acetyltransferase n=1 Tax=Phaeacidiphilus oryzae TaxID=348818 RepID=UPI00068A24DC|nr:GNAT family N-acetyltransferase [Phaeacidiphilus oryzae]
MTDHQRPAGPAARIQAVGEQDWELWRGLRLAALAQAPQAFKSRLADWERGGEARWRERLADPRALNLVARSAGEPVGLASGVPSGHDPAEACELRSLWVAPQARGRGVADLLIGEVEAWARRRGARTLRLAVIPGNAPATAAYRRHGFQDSAVLGDLLPDGTTRELVLEKSLDARPAGSRESPS